MGEMTPKKIKATEKTGLRWRVQRASLPDRPGRRSSLLCRLWTDSCKCPPGCYQLGRAWGEQVPRADANMMALGALAGQSSAPWGMWCVYVEGSTLLPEQEWSHLSSWRELVQQQKRGSNCLGNLVSARLLPPQPASPRKEEAQQGFSPRPTSFPSGHGSSELAWHLFLVPVGRHGQHLRSTKIYHLGSEGPKVLTDACRSELKSFCCLKSMRPLSWKELEKEVRFAGIPRDP